MKQSILFTSRATLAALALSAFALPARAQLDGVDKNKLSIKGSSMELAGIADTEKTIIDFSQNLKQQKHISDVQLQELQGGKKNSPQGTLIEFVEFKLLVGVRNAG